MKKTISFVLGGLAIGVILSREATAVVPSPVSLEEENPLATEVVLNSTSPRSISQVADKLAEDQRRLESVLQDLKEDQKALKQPDSKESQDGHSLH